ncbi:lipase/acyltransferase domain-containing protein [Actinomadura craniellae]|nr:alpha/beta hydrolase [Actinomadura craniellae]
MFRRLIAFLAALLLVSGMTAQVAQAKPKPQRPVIFVHGFSGSGSQFDTQARRFAGNGYPIDHIEAHEYDSLFQHNTEAQVFAGLDQRIDRLLKKTRADKVDLLGHSLGTRLMQTYLNSSPERAAKIAHYVNLDGAPAAAPPGGVPTLAVWGEGSTARQIVGAENVYFSDQGHTQTVTSVETFAAAYEFFTGKAPRTTRIVPQVRIELSGRAVLFPSNLGAEGARLEIYEVSPWTGARKSRKPVAVRQISGDGSWGPVKAWGHAHYEFAVVWNDQAVHHLYFQPFRRSDALVRLLTSRPGEGLSGLVETGPGHSSLTINRQKEWWGDQGTAGDSLKINGQEILNAASSPRTKRTIGIFAFDAGVDRTTDLATPIPAFFSQPFISGVDLYIPANGRPISLVATPRGGGHKDVLNVPSWPSATDRISVSFDDD